MAYFNNFSFLRPDDETQYGFESPYQQLLKQPAITVPQPSPQKDLASIYEQMLNQPETQEHQAYLDWIKKAPREADYKPSKMNRFGAVLAAAGQGFTGDVGGGIQTGINIQQAPYERALRSHEIEGRGLREAATLKRQTVEDRMQLLARMETSRLAQQNFELNKSNIESQIEDRVVDRKTAGLMQQKLGKELEMMGFEKIVNKVDGTTFWKNPFTGQSTTPIRTDESIAEGEKREKSKFSYQFGQEAGLRRELQTGSQTFQASQAQLEAERRAQAAEIEQAARAREATAQRQAIAERQRKQQEAILDRQRRGHLFREKLETEIKKSGVSAPSATRNMQSVMAAVLSNPERYDIGELFNEDDKGNLTLKPLNDVATPYQVAWRELYDMRFKGFAPPSTPFGKPPDIDFDK